MQIFEYEPLCIIDPLWGFPSQSVVGAESVSMSHINVFGRNIAKMLGQYRDRWCAGSMRCKIIGRHGTDYTMKPVCNDYLYDKIYYLWFIQ